ncbi:MAG: putative glycoside hydrolase [candidate division WOR-3 bacterium]
MIFLLFALDSLVTVVKEPQPNTVRGVYLPPGIFYLKKDLGEFFQMVDLGLINTVVLDIKNEKGVTFFNFYKDFIKKAKEKGIYLIGRQCVFKDEKLAFENRGELALKDLSGNIWFQEKDGYWVDPSLPPVWEYNLGITKKAFEVGFDEVQFDYIRYPSGDKPYKNSKNKIGNIIKFLELAKGIKPKDKRLSLTFYGYTVWNKYLVYEGQKFEEMSEKVDAIYPMLYPSHFHDYFMPDSTKEARTYSLIYKSVKNSQKRLPKEGIEIIPYIQAFSWKQSKLGKDYVFNQLKASYEANSNGFVLWNPRGDYKRGFKELIDFDIYFFKKRLQSRFIGDDNRRDKENYWK